MEPKGSIWPGSVSVGLYNQVVGKERERMLGRQLHFKTSLSHVEIEISIRRIVSKTLLRPSVVFIIIVSGAKFYWMVGRLILSAITEWTGVSNAVI